MPDGTTTPGVLDPPWPSPRTPLGPSDIFTSGMPAWGNAFVRHVVLPARSRHLSSSERAASAASVSITPEILPVIHVCDKELETRSSDFLSQT
jgi:hypothetical protein